jgi:hypothetical protein
VRDEVPRLRLVNVSMPCIVLAQEFAFPRATEEP